MPRETINIRYGSKPDVSPPPTPKRRGRPKKTAENDARKEALEKARAVLREKRMKEREAKKQLAQQEQTDDEVIVQRAKRSQELRMQKEETKRRMEELEAQRKAMEEEQKAIEEEAMRIAQEELDAEEPEPEQTGVLEPEQNEQMDIVKRVSKPGRKGRRVLVIDSSIFEDDEGVEVEYKRRNRKQRKPAPKPSRKKKADKRTRFVDEKPPSEEDEDEDEDEQTGVRRRGHSPLEESEEEEYQHYPPPPQYHEPEQDDYVDEPRQVQAPKLAPIRRKVLNRQQMNSDPLYGMIFG